MAPGLVAGFLGARWARFARWEGGASRSLWAAAVMYPEAMLSLQNGCDNIPGGDVIPPGDGYTVSAAGSYHSGRRT